jgi:hypothetical protein
MSKRRKDSHGVAANASPLDKLPQNQQDALEAWLFEEAVDYKAAIERLKMDFNVRTTDSSLSRFYKRIEKRRTLDRISEAARTADQVEKRFLEEKADLYPVILKMVSQIAFEQSVNGKQMDPEIVYNFTKLLIAGRKEELRKELITLQRERFQFDAAKACLKKLPELKQIASDNKLDQDEKLTAFRKALFGDLPEESETDGRKEAA